MQRSKIIVSPEMTKMMSQLLNAMSARDTQHVSNILTSHPTLKNQKLTPQPWAASPEQLLPIEYMIKYTEMPLDICFALYSEDDCQQHIDASISDVSDLTAILKRLPREERLPTAKRNQSKMTMQLFNVLNHLPEESRLDFTRDNPQAFEHASHLAMVLAELPQEDRFTCAMENSKKIHGDFDLENVSKHLPDEKRDQFLSWFHQNNAAIKKQGMTFFKQRELDEQLKSNYISTYNCKI